MVRSPINCRAFLSLILLPALVYANGPVPEDQLASYLEKATPQLEQRRTELRELISLAKRGRVSKRSKERSRIRDLRNGKRRYQFRSRDDKEKELAVLEEKLNNLPPSALPPPLEFGKKMEVGHIGIMPVSGTEAVAYIVMQVIDGNNALVKWRYSTPPNSIPSRPGSIRMIRILGVNRSELFLAKIPTQGIVDGKRIEFPDVYKVAGTYRYDTAVGSTNSVFVIEPFDIKPFLPKPKPHPLRTWTDVTGKHRIKAQFVDFIAGNVRLKRHDGKTVSVPIEKLSEADQHFARQQE